MSARSSEEKRRLIHTKIPIQEGSGKEGGYRGIRESATRMGFGIIPKK